MTDYYQRIAEAALDACSASPYKLLLYAEVEEGVAPCDVLYQLTAEAKVHFRFGPEILRDLIVEFWEAGDNQVVPRSWTVLSLLLQDGRFSAGLTYSGQLVDGENLADRRPRAIGASFPGVPVDYTRPRG